MCNDMSMMLDVNEFRILTLIAVTNPRSKFKLPVYPMYRNVLYMMHLPTVPGNRPHQDLQSSVSNAGPQPGTRRAQ